MRKSYLLLLFSLFIPYIILCFYAHPVADDFNYALKGGFDNDFWYQWRWEYFNWNGRYFSNILVLANPIGFGYPLLYQLSALLMILLTLASIWYFLGLFQLSYKQRFFVTLLGGLLYLFQMPTIAEGIYWYTGAVTYQLGNIFGLLYLTLIIRYFYFRQHTSLFFAIPLLIISCGLNEVMLLILFFFHLCLTFFLLRKNERKSSAVLLLVIVVLCFLFVALSPGNKVRGNFFQETSHDFIRSGIYTFLQTVRFSFYWITGIPLIIASLLFLAKPAKTLLQQTFIKKITDIPLLFSTLLPFIMIALAVFPAYWSTGKLGQHRTLNVAYFFFLICWFYNLLVWLKKYELKKLRLTVSQYHLALLFLILSLAITKNGYYSSVELMNGKVKAFDRELLLREKTLTEARGIYEVKIPLLENKPKTLFVIDISEGYGMINESYGLYYDVERVIGFTKN